MYKKIVVIVTPLLLLAISNICAQDPASGFYVLIENKTKCTNLVHTLSGEKIFCLPKDPVITESEFEQVGPIVLDKASGQKHFDLKLSAAGFEILKTLAGKLPDSQVALVIGGHVSGTYQSNGKVINRTLTIRGAIDSPDIIWMHDKIRKKN